MEKSLKAITLLLLLITISLLGYFLIEKNKSTKEINEAIVTEKLAIDTISHYIPTINERLIERDIILRGYINDSIYRTIPLPAFIKILQEKGADYQDDLIVEEYLRYKKKYDKYCESFDKTTEEIEKLQKTPDSIPKEPKPEKRLLSNLKSIRR